MSLDVLRASVERLAASAAPSREEALPVVAALLDALETGAARAHQRKLRRHEKRVGQHQNDDRREAQSDRG